MKEIEVLHVDFLLMFFVLSFGIFSVESTVINNNIILMTQMAMHCNFS